MELIIICKELFLVVRDVIIVKGTLLLELIVNLHSLKIVNGTKALWIES